MRLLSRGIERPALARSVSLAAILLSLAACLPQASASPIDLGRAGNYAVLGVNSVTISSGGVTGNVGVAAGNGALLKSTVNGDLFIGAQANPDIHHQDFFVTGQTSMNQNLSGAVSDARAASAFASSLQATQTFGSVTAATTFSSSFSTGGLNVINVDSLQLVKKDLTIQGGANDFFVINLTNTNADTIFNGARILLVGGVTEQNVLFNLGGTGGDLRIFKDTAEAHGIFLAPDRSVVIDNPTLFGSVIGGDLNIHSRGTVISITPVPELATFLPIIGLLAAVASTHYLRRRKLARRTEV